MENLPPNVKWIRFVYCDNANVIRAKSVYSGHPNLKNFLKHGAGLVAAAQCLPVFDDILSPGATCGGVASEVRIVPDLSTLRILPFAPTRAACASNLCEMTRDGTIKQWAHCPRYFLQRQIEALKKEGYSIKCSFEYEFSLLFKDKNDELTGLVGTFCNVHIENKYVTFVDDLTDALVAQGITPELAHKEAGLGQLEFVVLYDDPLKTADNHVVVRETIHAIADKHGLIASLIPKITEGIGAGCHMHVSLWKGDKNITSDGDYLGKEASHFVAGILEHSHALMAITTPTCNSFRRIKPGFWAGAYDVWGIYNKEAAIRVSGDSLGTIGNHWEIKIVDASSNPYLAIGSVIASGLDGLKKKIPLKPAINMDPQQLSEKERKEKNVNLLPSSLLVALEKLEKDEVLLSALGDLAGSFIAVRKTEEKYFSSKSLSEEVKILHNAY